MAVSNRCRLARLERRRLKSTAATENGLKPVGQSCIVCNDRCRPIGSVRRVGMWVKVAELVKVQGGGWISAFLPPPPRSTSPTEDRLPGRIDARSRSPCPTQPESAPSQRASRAVGKKSSSADATAHRFALGTSGCRCIGFQTGRVSMFSRSSACRWIICGLHFQSLSFFGHWVGLRTCIILVKQLAAEVFGGFAGPHGTVRSPWRT